MKTVILCGGTGTRLREHTEFKPKPLVEVGEMPMIWHIMKHYSHFNYKDFLLCLGYKGSMIKDFFINYWKINDFTLDLGNKNSVEYHEKILDDWKITFADTGIKTNTGERIRLAKKYLDDESFMMTYGDGLSNIDIKNLVNFHKKKGKIATISCTHATSKYGLVLPKDDSLVIEFRQKPKLEEFVNIGFAVFENDIFNYITKDCAIEDIFPDLIKDGELVMNRHDGFFHSMDTYKDFQELNDLWNSKEIPWRV